MTTKEKQQYYAGVLVVRGIISQNLADKIANAKVSHDLVESMIDIAAGLIDRESGQNMLRVMVMVR